MGCLVSVGDRAVVTSTLAEVNTFPTPLCFQILTHGDLWQRVTEIRLGLKRLGNLQKFCLAVQKRKCRYFNQQCNLSGYHRTTVLQPVSSKSRFREPERLHGQGDARLRGSTCLRLYTVSLPMNFCKQI